MKIDDVRIEEHGAWRELSLSFPQPGLTALYGPNEAGKSTLLRFLRGMLYGRRQPLGHREPESLRGELTVEHRGSRYTIDRRYDPSHDHLDVRGAGDNRPAERILGDLLQGVDRTVYEHVFAVGLREMQELGTLDEEAVAEWLYGTSLGPAGRHLATINEHVRTSRHAERSGVNRIARLTAEYGRLSSEIDELVSGPGIDDLLEERADLEASIARTRSRQETEQRNLRGYRLLARIHEPWSRVREYRQELDRLNAKCRLPKDGIAKLDRVMTGLSDARGRREQAHRELKSLTTDYKKTGEPDAFVDHACSIRGLLEVRDELADADRNAAPVVTEDVAGARKRLAEIREELGRDWNDTRLDKAAAIQGGGSQLTAAARLYQKSLVRRRRLRRLRKRLDKTVQKRQAELHGKTRDLAGRSVKDAIEDRRTRLAELESVGRLRAKYAELEERKQGIAEQIRRTHDRAAVPDWVYGVLCLFGIGGLVFCVVGLTTGVQTSALVGAIYAFLGVTCGGLAWALKLHFEEELRLALERLRDDEHDAEVALRETDRRIAKLVGETAPDATPEQQRERDAELVAATVRELIEFERLSERIESTVKLRKRQTALRNRFHSVQREMATARQQWTTTLRNLTLTETLKIDEAHEEWDRVVAAVAARRVVRSGERAPRTNTFERLHARVRQIARELGDDNGSVEQILARWERRLDGLESWRKKRSDLRSRIRRMQNVARKASSEIATWERRRKSLLRRAKVDSVEDFRKLARVHDERAEVEELLALAEDELQTVTAGDNDLAIVEEQLVDFDPANTREAIELAELELAELDGELSSLHERLGHVKKELADAETDERSANLRFERERVYEQLREAYTELAAVDVVERSARGAVEELERTYQPPTLAAASRYLQRLTLGRYDRIWTPFGESQLLVNGDGREAMRIENLSRGTREQVFLALRLALVSHLAEEGVELPFVLDDVLVNFDRDRTEAAVDTLLEFAREGRQVLCLTCHEHVAEMFERRGVEPIWLPSSTDTRMSERIAG